MDETVSNRFLFRAWLPMKPAFQGKSRDALVTSPESWDKQVTSSDYQSSKSLNFKVYFMFLDRHNVPRAANK